MTMPWRPNWTRSKSIVHINIDFSSDAVLAPAKSDSHASSRSEISSHIPMERETSKVTTPK